MRFAATFLVVLAAITAANNTSAQRFAAPTFGSAAALKVAQACIAYARAHNGAVNVWVYNERGEMLHFQRMDGAPMVGPSFNSGPQYGGGDPFRNGPGPVVAIPDTSPISGVPVVINGMTVGSVQAIGMGDEADRACAKAAADAAQADP